jgi:hypothetical protein
MKIPFAMGVGGTFDVAAGHVKRAPIWMQRSGLEWFYRFLQEPRRMFRRYFIEDMAFIGLLLKEAMNARPARQGSGGHTTPPRQDARAPTTEDDACRNAAAPPAAFIAARRPSVRGFAAWP